MAHEVESMFFTNATPWHRLGTRIERAPSIDEAIVAAGMDWTVSTEPALTTAGEPLPAVAIRRDSDRKILGVGGPSWTPLQNRDAFAWFDPFVREGFATLETAGSLRGGEVVWVLAKIAGDPLVIVPQSDDRIERFVLLSNAHNGRRAARVGFTPTRVVCANTLAAAHSDAASKLLRVTHHKGIVQSLEQIREVMDIANSEFVATAEEFRRLATCQINADDLRKYVRSVFRGEDEETVSRVPEQFRAKRRSWSSDRDVVFDRIVPIFEHGRGNDLPGVRGTLWAAYNAVTEYLTHERGNSRTTDDHRLDSLWFGDAARINRRALSVAREMATA